MGDPGGYEVVKQIGRGNFGVVSLVKSKKDNKQYVMKIIDLNELSKTEREGALQEVKLLARLRHPFIVKYSGSFLAKSSLHIIMHYCEGGDLNTRIRQAEKAVEEENHGHFSEEQVLDWFVQIALALQYCHHRKIIHRDLKSQNIFMTKKGNIRLGDFGIARVLSGTTELAMTVVGTPYSMSPEVCENKPYGYASDIWALGCVLYEMCVLKHAFDANNLLGLVWKIVQETFPPIPKIYSNQLRELLGSMLKKDPSLRPTIDEILEKDFVHERLHAQVLARTNNLRTRQSTTKTRPSSRGSASGDPSSNNGTRRNSSSRNTSSRSSESTGRDSNTRSSPRSSTRSSSSFQSSSPNRKTREEQDDDMTPRERASLTPQQRLQNRREEKTAKNIAALKMASNTVHKTKLEVKERARSQLQVSTPTNAEKDRQRVFSSSMDEMREALPEEEVRSQTANARLGNAKQHSKYGGLPSHDEVPEEIPYAGLPAHEEVDEEIEQVPAPRGVNDWEEQPIKAAGNYQLNQFISEELEFEGAEKDGGKEGKAAYEDEDEYADDFEAYKSEDEDDMVTHALQKASKDPKPRIRKRPVASSRAGARADVGPSGRQKCTAIKARCLRKMSQGEFESIYSFFQDKQKSQADKGMAAGDTHTRLTKGALKKKFGNIESELVFAVEQLVFWESVLENQRRGSSNSRAGENLIRSKSPKKQTLLPSSSSSSSRSSTPKQRSGSHTRTTTPKKASSKPGSANSRFRNSNK